MPQRGGRRLSSLIVSLLLHALVILALLVVVRMRPRQPKWLPPPSIDMVFQGGSKEGPSVPNQAPPIRNAPPSPEPAPRAVPAPPAPPAPPAAPASPERQAPPPQPPVPPEQPPTPSTLEAPLRPVPLPLPQTAAPSETVPPPLPAPPTTRPAPQPPMETAIQLVPPPPLDLLRPPAPLPQLPAPPRPAPRRLRPHPVLPTPMAYSFGAPPRLRGTPRGTGGRGAIDLAFAPAGSFSDRLREGAWSEDKNVGDNWFNLVAAWWQRHAYYPPEAGMNGEQGNATVKLLVRHDGEVEKVQLEGSSGSQWLDMAAVAVFRGATLPPLPADVTAAIIPLHFTIHYMIID